MTEITTVTQSIAPESDTDNVVIRPALASDVRAIKDLVDPFAKDAIMLPKTLSDLFETVRDFMVIEVAGEVAGMGALHVMWEDLAEIRTLAVHPDYQGKGYGKRVT
ncbi:MAG: GNAT family N-acetyltransferase, partial [Candidatus Omnitrophica bacterium]|nr:GNAT family N-acetyltransferase [Candidatus Omnitrophota bacterium]